MDCSRSGLPVHHQLPEFTQTNTHRVGDAIKPSHPLSSPSPPTFNLLQHQGLFKWVSSSHQVAKVLEFQLQYQSFQWTPRTGLFRMDWFDLLVAQGTLKSLLQHHSSKASVLRCSAFFIVPLITMYKDFRIVLGVLRGSTWSYIEKPKKSCSHSFFHDSMAKHWWENFQERKAQIIFTWQCLTAAITKSKQNQRKLLP